MQLIDWALTVGSVIFVFCIALYTKRYVKNVADFVAGGRAAGRYLICNAQGEAASGVSNTVSRFQILVTAGFVASWWDFVNVPVLTLVAISGWVIYRYRQTRAMTIGQYFEMRYSRRFRLFAGVLGFLSGLLNYGIFPAVSAAFFVYFMGLPDHVHIASLSIPTTAIIMALYLSGSLWMMTVGGQITLMVVDCIEGVISHLIYIVVVFAIFMTLGWGTMKSTLMSIDAPGKPTGHSMVNPFNQSKTGNFNYTYFIMYIATNVYGVMTVQKDNTFTSSARTPHESRMGRVLGNWRSMARNVMLVVVAIAAYSYVHQASFPAEARHALSAIKDSQTQDQMRIPISLRYLLPVGVKGLFCTMMVLGLTAGDAAHMLTWGGIFVQDVVLPLRKRPLSQKQHMLFLRLAVTFVAAFAFCFSLVWTQTQYIANWWAVTEAIFAGGAGVAIFGGLYWKKGTTAGAWSGVIVGSSLAIIGLAVPWWIATCPAAVKSVMASTPPFVTFIIKNFPNGTQVKFSAAIAAIIAYFTVSWLTCRQDHDMDKLLHRGKYAVADDKVEVGSVKKKGFDLGRLLGFDKDFTFTDKLAAGGIFVWTMSWLLIVIVASIWNSNKQWQWSTETWVNFWFIAGIVLPLIVATFTLFWFGIGGLMDMKYFFHRLSTMSRVATDDGRVRKDEAGELAGKK